MTSDLRIRVALTAAFATLAVLSLVSAFGYVAMVGAARDSQRDLLIERLDQLERRLQAGDELERSLQLDLSLQVVRSGQPVPEPRANVLQVVRPSNIEGIDALVGRVSTREIDQTLGTVRTALWISVLVVGLLVGSAAWFVVDRSLAPVRRLTARARAVEADPTLDLLPVAASGDEIAELADTFNSMLAKLRATDSERRRFVSDASHELRTPLMVLTAEAEYALDGRGDIAELARSVLGQSERLTDLVDDLLTLASIDEGRRPDEAIAPVADVLARAGIGGSMNDGLVVDVDRVTARQPVPDISRAVANVVANARRHATSRIAVSARGGGEASEVITVTIDDDGPGVPHQERAEIFRRFYRPDDGRSRKHGGAGLGLAIAKAQINQIGGAITVEDGTLGGARFRITIPVAGRS